jgi:predicted dehydrogenase
LAPYSLAVVGVGKIAREQRLPAIAKSRRFRLACVVSPSAPRVDGVAAFRTPGEA